MRNRLDPKLARQLRRTLASLGYRSTARGFVLAERVADVELLEGREQWEEQEHETERAAAEMEATF